MKYYKIQIKSFYGDRIASRAEGKNVPNNEIFFSKMRNDEIIENTPIFDYFILESFDEEKYWEWALFDVHNGFGDYPGNSNWFISDKLKILLENFKIAPKYYFYEIRLLYKGEKLKYWIFQFPLDPNKNIDFQKSTFYLHDDTKEYNFLSEEEFVIFYRKIYREYKKK
ncbi:hypothetical protein ACI760_10320 [Capnocytophaga canimorsus]|uniref:hypothetical protein n=1 Tax=Capnocytophaga canimorsus TaxID=28188 RepID=UPI00385ECF2C